MELNFAAYDLTTSRGRRALLKAIPPDRETVRKYHVAILDLFRREMDYRRHGEPNDDPEFDGFENIYWCGLLLYLAGDLADVSLMWEAKQIDMDTGCGFDIQFLLGAGVEPTLRFLEENKLNSIADYILSAGQYGDFDNLAEWERFRIQYFYDDRPV